jgi:hypothetical protein
MNAHSDIFHDFSASIFQVVRASPLRIHPSVISMSDPRTAPGPSDHEMESFQDALPRKSVDELGPDPFLASIPAKDESHVLVRSISNCLRTPLTGVDIHTFAYTL